MFFFLFDKQMLTTGNQDQSWHYLVLNPMVGYVTDRSKAVILM